MKPKAQKYPRFKDRQSLLVARRDLKMARSAHAYVRGNTRKFYEWLETSSGKSLPQGPAIWICGDCHVGNLGPVANTDGEIEIQIRDLDQTVIGNPAHDLIRLGLSLATAARGSDLPGVTTARTLEQLMEGYEQAFTDDAGDADYQHRRPKAIKVAMKRSLRRSWKELAKERIEDIRPKIPLGKRFWPLRRDEQKETRRIFKQEPVRQLVTALRSRKTGASIELLDAAYWMKGCSSLGRLRIAGLLGIGKPPYRGENICLMDIKEAIAPAAPHYPQARMPRDNGERVVEGALQLAPNLGERMLSARFLDRAVFLRELRPQDLQIEIEQLTRDEAMKVARFLGMVVGKAHARQLEETARRKWYQELGRNRSKKLDAPSWLWSSVVELLVIHESEYLEHCRKYAMIPARGEK
ncbi:MAG: DUF2252 family protein [Candidatus Binataceae bacterium]